MSHSPKNHFQDTAGSVLGMFDVWFLARLQKITENKSHVGHVEQVFGFISAIYFDYGVVYAVRDHFQQVTAKARSRSGKKDKILS